nr:MAG TPA: deoxyribosyltransferase [Caudoviricetes sp.]
MMATKCNRCGKFYETYNENKNKKTANGFTLLNINHKENEAYAHEFEDLCPECMKELHVWMNAKEDTHQEGLSIYISGPITGLKEEDARAAFEKAEKLLETEYERVVNPMRFESAYQSTNLTYDEIMDIDIRLLKMCKAIYMLKNWEGSKGACMERLTALQLGMKIIYED